MPRSRSADNARMQHRYERISIETPRQRITGTATLAADGYRSRLSDLLNAPERDFIALVDVIVEPLAGDGENVAVHDFIAVHRQHVVFVVSLGQVDEPQDHALLT
jgi:hypothetical protein